MKWFRVAIRASTCLSGQWSLAALPTLLKWMDEDDRFAALKERYAGTVATTVGVAWGWSS